jgi:hypothetical protein
MGKSEIGAAWVSLFLSCLLWIISVAPNLYAQANFYQGKSVRVIRGGQPGIYTTYGRALSLNTWENIFPATPTSLCRTCLEPVQ